ncbi:hypothetical protein ESCOCK403M_18560 [Escherichia coli]
MAHDVPLGCAPDEYDDLISGTCSHLPLVPCGFMLLAFVIIWFYPLTDKKFKEIVVEIDNRKKVQQQLISDITN